MDINTDYMEVNSSSKNFWYWKLKTRYHHTLVTSKLAILCLVWFGMELGLLLSIGMALNNYPQHQYILIVCLTVTYLVYPVFGYLGEKWTRYYVIMSGVLISCCGSLLTQLLLILDLFSDSYWTLIFALVSISVSICSFGFGMFTANIIQFSTIQIQFVSSQQLASFARWWVFTLFFGSGISVALNIFLSIVTEQMPAMFIILVILFVLIVGCVMIGVGFKHKFVIEPPPNIDPLKLSYQVVKYAWKQKYPERRSAFTYTDDDSPSRLDFGKSRYGGPFTTDQVESVKSSGNVLVVILSCILFSSFIVLGPQYVDNIFSNKNETSDSVTAEYILQYNNTNIAVVLAIPVLQLIIVPFFPYLIPNMLKRIWLGLLVMFVSFSAAAISYPLVSKTTFSSIVLGIGLLSNVGSAFIAFSSLEFILAQAPCQMQGLLLGIWGLQFVGENFLILILKITFDLSFAVPGLLLLSLVVYSFVMYHYKYRLRNEPSDINFRRRVEEIFERNFEKERAMAERSSFINSPILIV